MFLQKKHSKKIFEYYGLCFDNPCPKNYYAELEKIKWNLKRRTRKARSLRRDELSMKQKKKLKMLKTVEIAMEALKRGVMVRDNVDHQNRHGAGAHLLVLL
eukprot:GEZU01010737.1.p1 GENE.GEZU01010737.1~~GEZU01010737.1.p1  ORF type:complete len:101 (+),score=28.23 GEZU01010737.1:161-463(+)